MSGQTQQVVIVGESSYSTPVVRGVTCWERDDFLALVCGVCEFVTFPLVSWVRCGTWLYRFLIFAPLLTFLRGTVLGPLLFLIFINGLLQHIQSKVCMFADDCVVYREIKTKSGCEILPDDLHALKDGSQTGLWNSIQQCVVWREWPPLEIHSIKSYCRINWKDTNYRQRPLLNNLVLICLITWTGNLI